MAWIRIERDDNPVGSYNGVEQYGAICEEADDLEAEQRTGYAEYGGRRIVMGIGSLALCMETMEVSAKAADGTWKAVGGGSDSSGTEQEAEGGSSGTEQEAAAE